MSIAAQETNPSNNDPTCLLKGTYGTLQTVSTAKEATSQEIAGWGTSTDPAGDCKFVVNDERLMITIPGTHHDLNPGTVFGNNMLAPRVLQETDDHFTMDVTVDPLEHPNPAHPAAAAR